LHNPTIASRYSLLAEAYLRGCGAHRQELVKQNKVLNQLAKVAMRVKEAPSSSEKKKVTLPSLCHCRVRWCVCVCDRACACAVVCAVVPD
jgi:hypothetical protein